MYAKIAMLLLVAVTAAACAQNNQLACREFPTEYSVKGPGCALTIAEGQGEAPKPNDRPDPRDTPKDTPDDTPNDNPNDPGDPTGEPGGPIGTAPQ